MQQMREAGMPRVQHGRWDLMHVLPWYMDQRERMAETHHSPSLEAARKRKLAVDTKLAEHKLAESRGQSIPLDEHSAIVMELAAGMAGELEAYPMREYTSPDERDRAVRLCTHVRACLAELVQGMGLGARRRRPVAGPTADEEREPVGGGESEAASA